MSSDASPLGTVKKMEDRESPQLEVDARLEAESPVERGRARSPTLANAAATDASVNMDELREIIELIRENDFTEFELEREGFRVRFRRGAEATPVKPARLRDHRCTGASVAATSSATAHQAAAAPAAPVHPGAKAETAASEDQDLHIIPSPIVGTFYRPPLPTPMSL